MSVIRALTITLALGITLSATGTAMPVTAIQASPPPGASAETQTGQQDCCWVCVNGIWMCLPCG